MKPLAPEQTIPLQWPTSRSLLGRFAEWAPAGIAAVCALLFAGVVGGAMLFSSLSTQTARLLETAGRIEAARAALSAEQIFDGNYDFRNYGEARARIRLSQQAALDALRRLALASDSSAAHHQINDETILLQTNYVQAVDDMLGRPNAPYVAVADISARAGLTATLDKVQNSLNAAAIALIAEERGRVESTQSICDAALLVGPLGLGAGLVALIALFAVERRALRRREQRLEREAAGIRFHERRFRSLVHNAADLTLLCDASGRIDYQNPAAETRWGFKPDALLSHPLLAIIHPDDQDAVRELGVMGQGMEPGLPTTIEVRLADGGGGWRDAELTVTNLLANPDVQAIVCIVRDSSLRKARERALAQQGTHDRLTHLPNQLLLQDRLDHALHRARRRRSGLGLMLVRGWQESQDGVGHAGDPPGAVDEAAVLETVARLRLCLRATDTMARLHDGTLAVVVEEVDTLEGVRLVAERVAAEFARPGATAPTGPVGDVPSIGMVFSDPFRSSAPSLMQQALLALDRASPGAWVLFDPSMREGALDRTELEGDLRKADLRREMHVLYEPVMRGTEAELVGFEASVAWHHPTLGTVDAARFRSVAEETGLAVPIGRWAMEEACRQVGAWQQQARLDPPLSLGIRISARQFNETSLCADVAHALEASGLAPECLLLEVAERTILQDFAAAVRTMWELKELGVRIAVDDLGPGYSALPSLRQLPIDVLKLDAAGLRRGDGLAEPDGMDKACAMAALAGSLQMEVAASGVETQDQAALLWGWGCETARGALFHPAAPAEVAALVVRATARARSMRRSQGSGAPLRRPAPGKQPAPPAKPKPAAVRTRPPTVEQLMEQERPA